MPDIINVQREHYPKVKLVGKKYVNSDRDQFGSFGSKWTEWFEQGYFSVLEKCEKLEDVGSDYIGAMRSIGGEFEYWIGKLLSPDADVPDDFESVIIEAGDLGVCFIYGDEKSGELFGMDAFTACVEAFKQQGWITDLPAPDTWWYERYNCPRYTTPDEKGNVILDMCVYL